MIEEIKRKLAEYQELTEAFVAQHGTGSFVHYQNRGCHISMLTVKYNPPADEGAVATFEARHNIQLPEDYRAFLRGVGNGRVPENRDGAPVSLCGPALLSVEKLQNRADYIMSGELGQPFITRDWWQAEDERDADAYPELTELNGLIMIDGRCGESLVITGPERGQLWIDDIGSDNGVWPIVVCEGAISYEAAFYYSDEAAALPRVTFSQWYLDWLDRALEKARKGEFL